MDNNEQKIYEHITREATSKMDFNQIVNKVDYSQYEKEKKTFQFPRRLAVSFTTLALTFVIVLMVILIPNLNNENTGENIPGTGLDDGKTPGDSGVQIPGIQTVIYDGFIIDSFKNNIGDGPSYDMSGPIPQPPMIDGYFNNSMDYNNPDEGNPNSKPEDIIILEMQTFSYIYEVEYKNTEENEYVTVYLEKNLANKIYEENKVVMDAPNAAPLNIVNGSIVDWFYSKSYYNENKVLWYKYDSSEQIYSEIDGYVCVGVYNPQQRVIVREIFSNTQVNIVENVYTNLYFTNDGNEFLTPVVDKANYRVSWFASHCIINGNNTNMLFAEVYNNKMDCTINKEENTIKLKTYAVQNEDELSKNYSTLLKDYHIWSNSVIVENTNPDKKLGQDSYITYKYDEFVEILQELAKYK